MTISPLHPSPSNPVRAAFLARYAATRARIERPLGIVDEGIDLRRSAPNARPLFRVRAIRDVPDASDHVWSYRAHCMRALPDANEHVLAWRGHISGKAPTITIASVQRAAAKHFGVRHEDLIGQRRLATFALPRQIAMYVARVESQRSYPEIGRRFGGRDHTTAMHAFSKIEALVASDPDVAGHVEAISRTVRGIGAGVSC